MDAASSGGGGGGGLPAAPAADSGGASADGAASKKRRRSGPRSRSSPYTGVTQYKRTGNWEAHIWVQNPRGKGHQRHLGSYLTAEDAARCYDRAVLKLRGEAAETNFPREFYAEDEFLRAHERTERDRFLDLLRDRFALKSNATQAASGPTRTQPPRPKRKQSPGYTPNGSEAVPDSPRYRTVVRAPRSSPMGTASMTAASAAFPAGSPHRVTVHQWPAGGHSPALASPLPRQALRHSSSPQGRGSGGFGSSGGGYAAGGGYGNGGGSGLLRQDSLGGASEDQLLITTSAPAATAEMRDAMLWPSLPISSAPALGATMPLPGPLSPLSSLPQSPTGLAPTPLMHLGQLSPAPPPLGRVWGGGLGGALSPIRPLGVLSALSLPGSRAATPAGSPGRFGSPPPLPPIPSFRDLGQLAPALQHATDGGDGPAMLSPGSAALGTLAGIQAQLSSLEAPGVPAAMSSPSLHANGSMSGPMSGPMSTPAGLQHLSLLSFPPLPLIGGGSLQDASGSTPFAFPSFGHGSGITSSMLQAASAAAAASAARAAGASQPAALPAVGCDEHAAPAVSTSPALVFGVHGAASLGRWWQQGSPARPEGPSQDWLAASLPAADLSAGSVFLA